ncbi:MAG: C40 family peptidase [Propionibacteriales bacterium]|nr:C40 family peptidase [Propionibacteriales bacterium]
MPATAAWRRLFAALPLLLAIALALPMFTVSTADAAMSRRERKIHHGVQVARNQKGDPYVYGAEGPNAFDCSGLTMYSYGKAGIYLPRSSDAQYRYVRHIKKSNIRRGDLMFFHSGGSVYHVAIFLGRHDGNTWLLHASRPGTPVKRDPAWTRSWYAGTLRHRG